MYIKRFVSVLLFSVGLFALGTSASAQGMGGMGGGGGGMSGGGDATYSVAITGVVTGNSLGEVPWSGGGGKTINGPQHNAGELTNFALIAGTFSEGHMCFPGSGTSKFPLEAGTIKPVKKGMAQAQLWFEAKTNDGLQTLFYLLGLTGKFGEAEAWPPSNNLPTHLYMDHWTLTATNEGEDIKSIACIGDGALEFTITINEL